MVRIFKGFHGENGLRRLAAGITIVRSQDYTPRESDPDFSPKDDSPWVRRFALDGGRVIVSGDSRMMKKPHERLALLETGLTTIFFPPRWVGWKFCQKSALLMYWWPVILETVKNPTPGFFRVPLSWPDDGIGELQRLSTENLKMLKIERQKSQGDAIRAARSRRRDELAAAGDLLAE